MNKRLQAALILAAGAAVAQLMMPAFAADAGKLRVIYDQTRTGFAFPESIVYDPGQKVFYVSNFGGSELKPAEKDGMSPEHAACPVPPVAGCSPAVTSALPVSTLQLTPSPILPCARSVINAAFGVSR